MILIDLNVLLDVIQKREPHFASSAALLDHVLAGKVEGAIPAHALTTIHYLVNRHNSQGDADQAIDWLLAHFSIAGIGKNELIRARSLGWSDFEDAVVVAAAQSSGCQAIITRNVRDFTETPIPTMTPQEFLTFNPEDL